MKNERPWLLGLELSPRSSGALQFARWLRGTLNARVLGVYVHELWLSSLPPGEGAAFTIALRNETVRWMADLGPGEPGDDGDVSDRYLQRDARRGRHLAICAGDPYCWRRREHHV